MEKATLQIREMISDISAEVSGFTIADDRILTVINSLCDIVDKQEETIKALNYKLKGE
jgi:hypothetical protein